MNTRDLYVDAGLADLAARLNNILSSVIMAYQLAGYEISQHRLLFKNGVRYRVIAPPIVFFIWIIPVKHYVFFRRFRVDIEFNSNVVEGNELYTLKTLPEAFSKAFESAYNLPLDLFTK